MDKAILFFAFMAIAQAAFAQDFKTVKMPDGKVWMAENLSIETGNSLCYDNKEDNCKKCGRLYDWATAKKACPNDWHLPTSAEWAALEKATGATLKSHDGFNALVCGRYFAGKKSFINYGLGAHFWSATEINSASAKSMVLDAILSESNYSNYKNNHISVRCVEGTSKEQEAPIPTPAVPKIEEPKIEEKPIPAEPPKEIRWIPKTEEEIRWEPTVNKEYDANEKNTSSSIKKSALASIALGLTGAVLVYNANEQFKKSENYYNEYRSLDRGKEKVYYDEAWLKADNARSKGYLPLALGGISIVSAIGVYVWF